MKPKLLACIDAGTNTFRLLIAETDGKGVKKVHSERIITRLGCGMSGNRFLSDDAMKRGIAALEKFQAIVSHFMVDGLVAVGTSALREATNGTLFVTKAKEASGIDIRIISAKEEALHTSTGMLMELPSSGEYLLMDIGGGSTECIYVTGGRVVSADSHYLGAVYTADRCMDHDPLHESDIRCIKSVIQEAVDSVKLKRKEFSRAARLVGTGGTITTLSAMKHGLEEFSPSHIHNSLLSLSLLEDIFSHIISQSSFERIEQYPILRDGRHDIIVPGTFILVSLMNAFGFQEIRVSDHGLMEGLLMHLYLKLNEVTSSS